MHAGVSSRNLLYTVGNSWHVGSKPNGKRGTRWASVCLPLAETIRHLCRRSELGVSVLPFLCYHSTDVGMTFSLRTKQCIYRKRRPKDIEKKERKRETSLHPRICLGCCFFPIHAPRKIIRFSGCRVLVDKTLDDVAGIVHFIQTILKHSFFTKLVEESFSFPQLIELLQCSGKKLFIKLKVVNMVENE